MKHLKLLGGAAAVVLVGLLIGAVLWVPKEKYYNPALDSVRGKTDWSKLALTWLPQLTSVLGLIGLGVIAWRIRPDRVTTQPDSPFFIGAQAWEENRERLEALSKQAANLEARSAKAETRIESLEKGKELSGTLARQAVVFEEFQASFKRQVSLVEAQNKNVEALVGAFKSASPHIETVRDKQHRPKEPDSLDAAIKAESDLLAFAWQKWEGREAFKRAIEEADRSKPVVQVRGELIRNLGPALVGLPNLQGLLQAVLAPLQEFETTRSQFRTTEWLIGGGGESDLAHLLNLRKSLYFLHSMTSEGRERVLSGSNFERWLAASFVSFADEFWLSLQREAPTRRQSLQGAQSIILQALKTGGIVPIEIAPRRTRFDASEHEAISQEVHGDVGDGLVVGVVKNGFRFQDGRIQRAKVIVNRVTRVTS